MGWMRVDEVEEGVGVENEVEEGLGGEEGLETCLWVWFLVLKSCTLGTAIGGLCLKKEKKVKINC